MKKNRLVGLCILLFVLSLPISCTQKESRPIDVLTSKEANGRRPGTDGHKMAKEYIANYFKNLGLSTIDNQDFVVPGKEEELWFVEDITFSVDFESQKRTFEYGKDFILYTLGKEDSLTLENVDLTGNSQDISLNFASFFNYGSVYKNSRSEKTSLLLLDTYENMPWNNVKSIKLNVSASTVTLSPQNVIGIIKGADSKNAVIIGAHYDHMGMFGNTVIPGAFDNASGVDCILSLATQLKTIYKDSPPPQDIVFIAFDMEEYAFEGSKSFVNIFDENYDKGILLNFDCIGHKEETEMLINPSIKEYAKEESEKIFSPLYIGEPTIVRTDDHLPSDAMIFEDNDNIIYCTSFLSKRCYRDLYPNTIHCEEDKREIIDEKKIDAYVDKIANSLFESNQIFNLFHLKEPDIITAKKIFQDISYNNIEVNLQDYEKGFYYNIGGYFDGVFNAHLMPNGQKIYFLEYADRIENIYNLLDLGDIPEDIADTKHVTIRFYYDEPPIEDDLIKKKNFSHIGIKVLGDEGKVGFLLGAVSENDPNPPDETFDLTLNGVAYEAQANSFIFEDKIMLLKNNLSANYLFALLLKGNNEQEQKQIDTDFQNDVLRYEQGYYNCIAETEKRLLEKYGN